MSRDNRIIALVYPGGRFVNVSVPNTAGNVEYDFGPPSTSIRWLILSGLIYFTADANAADRYVRVFKMTGAQVTEELFQNTAAIIATKTLNLVFGEAKTFNGTSPSSTTGAPTVYTGIDPILLHYPNFLRIGVLNGLAGDTFSGVISLLQLGFIS